MALNMKEILQIIQLLKDNFTIIRYRDWEKYKDRKDLKICILRHDLDNSAYGIDFALEVAELEYSMGVHSSFFVLHSTRYYHQPDFISKCKKIENMGHEIGLHYNTIDDCLRNTSLTHKMIIEKELAFLKSSGIEICSISPHGHAYKTENGKEICAYDIWKELFRRGMPTKYGNIDLYTLSITNYGFYETQYIKRLKPIYCIADYTPLAPQIQKAIRDRVDFCEVLLHPEAHLIPNVNVKKEMQKHRHKPHIAPHPPKGTKVLESRSVRY